MGRGQEVAPDLGGRGGGAGLLHGRRTGGEGRHGERRARRPAGQDRPQGEPADGVQCPLQAPLAQGRPGQGPSEERSGENRGV